MRAPIGTLVAVTMLCAAGGAAAEPSPVLVVQGIRALADDQRAVHYGDLRLTSASGQQALRARVGLAIAELCDPARFSVAEPADSLKCTRDTWAAVEPELSRLAPRLAVR